MRISSTASAASVTGHCTISASESRATAAPIDSPVRTKVASRSQVGSITLTPISAAIATASAPPISHAAGRLTSAATPPPAAEISNVTRVRRTTVPAEGEAVIWQGNSRWLGR